MLKMTKIRYGLFRGEKLVGNIIYDSKESALKERDKWNQQFEEYNKNPIEGKKIVPVEVKEYIKPRMTKEQKLREMFS